MFMADNSFLFWYEIYLVIKATSPQHKEYNIYTWQKENQLLQ